ncbi:hypothetical protein LX36DRAFT_701672 [Colletotrichum falcatum]|nr:hypothetical protein LX36DRAFT_701672 [Colletotrichum falcatum]
MSVYENDDYLGSEANTLANGEGEMGTPRVVYGKIFRKRHDSFRREPADDGQFWLQMKELSNDNICTVKKDIESHDIQDELTPSEIRHASWAEVGELGYSRPVLNSNGEVCGRGLIVIRENNQRMPAESCDRCDSSGTHIETLIGDTIDQDLCDKGHKAGRAGSCIEENALREWVEATLQLSAASGSDHTLEFTQRLLDKADQQGDHERAIYAALSRLPLSSHIAETLSNALKRLVLRLPGAEYEEALEISHGHDGTWSEGRPRLVCVGYVRLNNPLPGPETDLLLSSNGLDGVTRTILCKRDEQAPLRLYNIAEDRVEGLSGRVAYAALSYVWGQWTTDGLKRELRDLSIFSGIRYAWVDAWCINQDNKQDKETEIPKMGSYYGGASLTLALLPDYDPPWALTRRGLEHPVMPSGLGCQLERWRKVEAALSANVVLRTKRGYMNLQTAEIVAESCRPMFAARPAVLYPGSRSGKEAASVTPPNPKQHLRSYHWASRVDTSRRRMRDVVTLAAGRKCQEAADHIFGLAALAEGQESLRVDYSRDINDIVAEAFEKWRIPPLTLFAPTVAAAPGSCWQAENLEDVSPSVIQRLAHWTDGVVLDGKAIVVSGQAITTTLIGRTKYGHIGTGEWDEISAVGEEGELLCITQWDGWVLAVPGYISGPLTWHRTGPATLSEFKHSVAHGLWKIGLFR